MPPLFGSEHLSEVRTSAAHKGGSLKERSHASVSTCEYRDSTRSLSCRLHIVVMVASHDLGVKRQKGLTAQDMEKVFKVHKRTQSRL